MPQPIIVVATVTKRKMVISSGMLSARMRRVLLRTTFAMSRSTSAPTPGMDGTASVPWHARAMISDCRTQYPLSHVRTSAMATARTVIPVRTAALAVSRLSLDGGASAAMAFLLKSRYRLLFSTAGPSGVNAQ